MTRTVFVHVGASKTGTSALQRGLFNSLTALAQQGVGMPLPGRVRHVNRLLRPLGWVTASGFVNPPRQIALEWFVTQVRETPGSRLILTCEDLCELQADRLDLLVEVLERADAEVRVVLTLRSLALVIPSEWQQFLKHRLTVDYLTFLNQLRDGRGRWAKHFWLRQDVGAICRRWAARVGTGHVVVIVVPDRTADPLGLYRMFGETVGFDPDELTWPTRDVNPSWGYVEAEVYRRVNTALGTRLPDYDTAYQPALRWPFVQRVLPRGRNPRIPLPPEHLAWVTGAALKHVDFLRTSGIRVLGDVDLLVPGPDSACPLPPLDEAEVARAAIETLANYAVRAWREGSSGGSSPMSCHAPIAVDGPVRTTGVRWNSPADN